MTDLEEIKLGIRRLEESVHSTDPVAPGLAMRMDRVEQLIRTMRWIGGGGLAGLCATLVLLYQILGAISDNI